MATTHDALSTLKHELEFLDHGGYRTPAGGRQPLFCMESETEWRPSLFFEDSPSCPKKRYCECSLDRNCVLMGYVPVEHQQETVPCRHIPLNERGDTIESLSKTHTRHEVEAVLRGWLVKTIAQLEKTVAQQAPV